MLRPKVAKRFWDSIKLSRVLMTDEAWCGWMATLYSLLWEPKKEETNFPRVGD